MRDWFALESCGSYEALTQLELVGRLVEERPERSPSRGRAVRALLDEAIDDDVALCRSKPDAANTRLARLLEARREGRTITAIAAEWGLTRDCVSRKVGRRAILLVTDRVLARNRRCGAAGRVPGREPVALPVRAGLQPSVQYSA